MTFDPVSAITIDRKSDEPVYAQIARQIRARIVAGELLPGAVLPSVRLVASSHGVNLNTVARAYRMLEADGFIIIRERSGAVIAAPPGQADGAVVEKLTHDLALLLARMRQAGLSTGDLRRLIDGVLSNLEKTAV